MNVRSGTVCDSAETRSSAIGGGSGSEEDIVLLLQLLLTALREFARHAPNTDLPQLWVYLPLLRQVAERPGITLNELARAVGMPKSQVSVLIARLARLGIVRKQADEHDTRLVHLCITSEGRRQAGRWRAISGRALLRTLQPLSDDQRGSIVQGLRTLVSALQPGVQHGDPERRSAGC
jgi:DNA-binding MarR family transcriptional regulator